MQHVTLPRRLLAELLGTMFLLATVVGAAFMVAKLFDGNAGLMLLAASLATGAMLTVLIGLFGPISGAHFNPIVSLSLALRGELSWAETAAYIGVQIAAGIVGVWLANLMFGAPFFALSDVARSGPLMWFSEAVASFGLLLVVFGCSAKTPKLVAPAVGLYVAAGYWFTVSTCFANPAVTIARMFTSAIAGIAPIDAPGFLIGELAGMGLAVLVARLLWPAPLNTPPEVP